MHFIKVRLGSLDLDRKGIIVAEEPHILRIDARVGRYGLGEINEFLDVLEFEKGLFICQFLDEWPPSCGSPFALFLLL